MMEKFRAGLRHREQTQDQANTHEQDQQQNQEIQNRQRNDGKQVDNRNRGRSEHSSHKWNSNSSSPSFSTSSPLITAATCKTTSMILEITPLDHDGDDGSDVCYYDSSHLSPRSVAAQELYYDREQQQQQQRRQDRSGNTSTTPSSTISTSKLPMLLLFQPFLTLNAISTTSEKQEQRDDNNNCHLSHHRRTFTSSQKSTGTKKVEKVVRFSPSSSHRNEACIEAKKCQNYMHKDQRKAVYSNINQKQLEYYRRVLKHDIYKYTVLGYRENDGSCKKSNNDSFNNGGGIGNGNEKKSPPSHSSNSSFTTLGLMDKISGSSRRTARIALREAAWSSVLWEVYLQKRQHHQKYKHKFNRNDKQERLNDDAVAAVYYDASVKATIIAREEALQLQKQLYGNDRNVDYDDAIKSCLTSPCRQAVAPTSSINSGRIRTALI